jgi:hypothetical protein
MASVGALAFCVTGITTIVTGALADRAIAKGATPTKMRKTCVILGLGLATSVVAVVLVDGPLASMGCLMFACIAYGVFASSHWAIPQTIAGPLAAWKWTGWQNCLANLAGVVAPAVTGFAVERTGHFSWGVWSQSTGQAVEHDQLIRNWVLCAFRYSFSVKTSG